VSDAAQHAAGRALVRPRLRVASPGALVIGADYRALGVVRSLGRRGIRVQVLRHGDDRLATASRYCERTLKLPHGDDAALAFLLELADSGLADWTLFASADETAALVGRNHAALAARYRLTTPPWETVQFAHDKRLTYRFAEETGVAEPPRTWYPRDAAEVAALDCPFPVALKPAVKEGLNRLTAAKAWRVESRDELVARYADACTLVSPDVLMVQEIVDGGGESQLSYAALCADGVPLASVVARRTRQYPMDFGRASTHVETVEDPEVERHAVALLARLRFDGVVEVEFKRDPRDGRLKLLDVNPRVWGWHTLCGRAGVDFPYLMWRHANGEAVPETTALAGVRWVRMSTDLPTVLKEIRRGRLSIREYLRSLRPPRESAIFAWDDPLPGLLEGPLLAGVLVQRLARGGVV
jgi:predicted ATP-grasp superfamily ATP-dependent carboligase